MADDYIELKEFRVFLLALRLRLLGRLVDGGLEIRDQLDQLQQNELIEPGIFSSPAKSCSLKLCHLPPMIHMSNIVFACRKLSHYHFTLQ